MTKESGFYISGRDGGESPMVLAYERNLFSDGTGNTLVRNPDLAATTGYVSYVPGHKVDAGDRSVWHAKEPAVWSAFVDRYYSLESDPGIAGAIIDRYISEKSPLHPRSQGLFNRLTQGDRAKAFSLETIRRYADMHRDGLPGLAQDVTAENIAARAIQEVGALAKVLSGVAGIVVPDESSSEKITGSRRRHSGLVLELMRENIGSIRIDEKLGPVFDFDTFDDTLLRVINDVGKLNQKRYADRHQDEIEKIKRALGKVGRYRYLGSEIDLFDKQRSLLIHIPSNYEKFEGVLDVLKPKRRETITVAERPSLTPLQIAELEAARAAKQAQAEAAAAHAERVAAQKREIDEKNLPIIEAARHIAEEYEQLITGYYADSAKRLRELAITGHDSLSYHFNTLTDGDRRVVTGPIGLYGGLLQQGSYRNDFGDILDRAADLQDQFQEYMMQITPGGTITDIPVLERNMLADWFSLREQVAVVAEAIWLSQAHRRVHGDAKLEDILDFLGYIAPSQTEKVVAEQTLQPVDEAHGDGQGVVDVQDDLPATTDEPDAARREDELGIEHQPHEDNLADTQSIEARLARLRALAEQLDWEVMPNQSLTRHELIEVISSYRKRSGFSEKREIEEYRINLILDLRNLLQAKLYHSKESQNSFYFVLTFEYDGTEYAIAENPIYGNATYILRKDLMPLAEGESLLTAVKELSRGHLRDLGAAQIIHKHPDENNQAAKIIDAIHRLGQLDPL